MSKEEELMGLEEDLPTKEPKLMIFGEHRPEEVSIEASLAILIFLTVIQNREFEWKLLNVTSSVSFYLEGLYPGATPYNNPCPTENIWLDLWNIMEEQTMLMHSVIRKYAQS
ncbi:hypothetical protein ACJX0J_014992 [Zea mays]